jgi:hypothetical protein
MKLVFCLTGKTYSKDFLLERTDLVMRVASAGHQVMVSQQPTLSQCLAFPGTEYDASMWIDSDVLFRPEDFFNLLESPHDITAGFYARDPSPTATALTFDAAGTVGPDDAEKSAEQYMPLDWTGLGWMLIRKGVFESIDGPPFAGAETEAIAFGLNATKAGHVVYADTKIRVGHQTLLVI